VATPQIPVGGAGPLLASPGEVLVTRTATDLVTSSGLRFAERGGADLPGVPGRWELLTVDRAIVRGG
jgi:hypothetical protein